MTQSIGPTSDNRWRVSETEVDVTRARPEPRPTAFPAEPKDLTIDLAATAMVVVDMQNDFCHPRGRAGQLTGDVATARRPIEPLRALLPALRAAAVPIVWVNWGNRPDRLNLSPAPLATFKRSGIGIGEPLPEGGHAALQKDSWDAAVVDELAPEPGDVLVDKYRLSGFWDTPLDSILRNLGATTLLFAGVNLDQCVLHTLADANFLGYDCVLLDDCAATSSPDYCREATLYNIKRCFGFVAESPALLAALD